jgi:hypothetical protein
MVRRIVIDSDFESDNELLPQPIPPVGTSCSKEPNRNAEFIKSPVESKPVPCARRVVRKQDVETSSEASFTVDSDIWTEESSIGSFIVHTDEFSEDDTKGCDSGALKGIFAND